MQPTTTTSTTFPRVFSTDSAKAIKASGYGYLNAIHYMAPADTSGYNLCAHSTLGCRSVCLGKYSGQAAMVTDLEEGTNSVRESRVLKAHLFMKERPRYMNELARATIAVINKAKRENLTPCIRLNGSTDIAFERIRFQPDARTRAAFEALGLYFPPSRAGGLTLHELFHWVQFVDYTKNPERVTSPSRPSNLHLTFSRSESNASEVQRLLDLGHNVAVVFAHGLPVERKWMGYSVVDGDRHDLRHLDPTARNTGRPGFVVGLTPKGTKAKRDMSGFVWRG